MNIYTQKQRWKLLLLIAALLIGIASLWYTNTLVRQLSGEEKKKVELWAQSIRQMANLEDDTGDFSFYLEVQRNNTTVPVILTDENDQIITTKNLDPDKTSSAEYLADQLAAMKNEHQRIDIPFSDDQRNYIYYKNSILLNQLKYYPYFQLAVIALFLFVSYLAFSASRKAEQNQVWIGMAKETAHQLGTPLSSLIAWVELLKMKGTGIEITEEVEKDVSRLNTITERFSKIGSAPALRKENIYALLDHSVEYIRSRTSDKVHFYLKFNNEAQLMVPLNTHLFEWVIENICKNAIDAMEGKGSITINVTDQQQFIYVDIADTGKGVPKSHFKTIFKPGFTTKSRGWGLGLSLTKRIVEEYHKGHIFVKNSEPSKGTTFRIVLNKQAS